MKGQASKVCCSARSRTPARSRRSRSLTFKVHTPLAAGAVASHGASCGSADTVSDIAHEGRCEAFSGPPTHTQSIFLLTTHSRSAHGVPSPPSPGMPVKALRFSNVTDTPGRALSASAAPDEADEAAEPSAAASSSSSAAVSGMHVDGAAAVDADVDGDGVADAGAQRESIASAASFGSLGSAASSASLLAESSAAAAASALAAGGLLPLAAGAAAPPASSAAGAAAPGEGEGMQVILRLRPLSEAERRAAGDQTVIALENAQTVRVTAPEVRRGELGGRIVFCVQGAAAAALDTFQLPSFAGLLEQGMCLRRTAASRVGLTTGAVLIVHPALSVVARSFPSLALLQRFPLPPPPATSSLHSLPPAACPCPCSRRRPSRSRTGSARAPLPSRACSGRRWASATCMPPSCSCPWRGRSRRASTPTSSRMVRGTHLEPRTLAGRQHRRAVLGGGGACAGRREGCSCPLAVNDQRPLTPLSPTAAAHCPLRTPTPLPSRHPSPTPCLQA